MHNTDICPITASLKLKIFAAKFAKARDRTRKRAAYLRSRGYRPVTQWEYQVSSELSPKSYLPPSCIQWLNKNVSDSQLLAAVRREEFFGVVECDLEVPESWRPGYERELRLQGGYFSEFCLLFCTIDIEFEHLNAEMHALIERDRLTKQPH